VAQPRLIVVSGPAGFGKTTLAHALARRIGCPAICRDEIKEGMVHAAGPGFVATVGDPLTVRTLPAFFGVLRLLLEAGVTTVAEAAFQDHVWRPNLEPLLEAAELRIVQCTVAHEVAVARRLRRTAEQPTRRAHADGHHVSEESFRRLALDAPSLWVDTAEGYAPGLDEIAAFAGA
jgi:predicted kinase